MYLQKVLSDFLFYFYALFIFGSTFSIAIGQMGLGIAAVLFVLLFMLKKKNPFPSQIRWFWLAIVLYIVWMALASLFGATPEKSISILKEEWLFIGVPIGIYLFSKEQYRHKLLVAFAIGIALVSVYGLIQYVTGVHWFKATPPNHTSSFGYIVKGFFAHRLTFGNYYATASLCLWGYLLFGWNYISQGYRLSLLVTMLSYSFGPILALLGGFMILLVARFRKKAVYLIGTFLLIISIGMITIPGLYERARIKLDVEITPTNESSRIYIWDNAVNIIKQHPFFGVGQGNFQTTFGQNMPGHRVHVHAHNDFLNIGALGGIPAMLFFAAIWLSLLGYYWRGIHKRKISETHKTYIWAAGCGALVFLFSSLTEATFADEEVRQMLMFVWAAGLWPLCKTKYQGTHPSLPGKTS